MVRRGSQVCWCEALSELRGGGIIALQHGGDIGLDLFIISLELTGGKRRSCGDLCIFCCDRISNEDSTAPF